MSLDVADARTRHPGGPGRLGVDSSVRCAVLVHPHRIWSNPAGSEHLDPQETP